MNLYLKILLLFLPLCIQAQFIHNLEFGENPGDLKMSIYLPKNKSAEKIPVVVALHGCSQNAKSMAWQTGWNTLADKYNFAVLYPEQRRKNNSTNCFNWFEIDDISENSGECGSIYNMITYGLREFNLDTQYVYIYGLSAGAAMSLSMMAIYPDKFKSGAIYAGVPFKTATNKKEGFEAVKKEINLSPEEWASKMEVNSSTVFPQLIVLHGKDDQIVPISYSNEIVEQWAQVNKISTLPDKVESNFDSNSDVTRLSYYDKSGKEKIIFYKFENLRHEVAIDTGNGEKQGGNKSVFSKDIDFFSTYWIAKDFGLIK
jgi:feruloyl esterase